MTTHHLLMLCIGQWRTYWHVTDPAIRHHCRVTFLRYMWRITHNTTYDRWWLRHVFLPRHVGPRHWAWWLTS